MQIHGGSLDVRLTNVEAFAVGKMNGNELNWHLTKLPEMKV